MQRRLTARIVAAVRWLRSAADQIPCLLIGHDGFREILPGELFVRCKRCWHRSPGWQLRGKVLAYSSSWPRARRPDPPWLVAVDGCFGTVAADDPTVVLAENLMAAGDDQGACLLLAATDGKVH